MNYSWLWKVSTKYFTVGSGPENLKKSRPKNSWNQINQFHEIFWTKIHFLQFQKWPRINFWTRKKFKTAKNAMSRKNDFDSFDFTNFWPGLLLIFWPAVQKLGLFSKELLEVFIELLFTPGWNAINCRRPPPWQIHGSWAQFDLMDTCEPMENLLTNSAISVSQLIV